MKRETVMDSGPAAVLIRRQLAAESRGNELSGVDMYFASGAGLLTTSEARPERARNDCIV
jgi:hypothetical protein